MDEEEFECEAPVGRFTVWVFLMHFFGLLMGIFNTFGVFFEQMLIASVAAANKGERDIQFHEEAALEIETLTGGTDG